MPNSLRFADLQKGHVFARFPFAVTSDEVHAYLDSTGESPDAWQQHIPPIFIDALAIAELLATVDIPRGVMHIGEEHRTHRAARIDESFEMEMRVSALSERRGAIMATFEAELQDIEGTPVVTMEISVMVLPEGVTV